MFNSFEELESYCQQNKIKMIDFKMIDLLGRWRHLTIPVGRFTPSTLTSGIGFDGSNYGYAPVEKSDMVFIPDLKTAFLDPFCDVPTISMIGDIFVIGNPHRRFEQDPRTLPMLLRITLIYDIMTKCAPDRNLNSSYLIMSVMKLCRSAAALKVTQTSGWNSGNNELLNQGFKIPVKAATISINLLMFYIICAAKCAS